MNLNISHIAGLCLDTLRFINRPSIYIGAILILSFIKVILILLRTIFYERKLIMRLVPKTVIKLSEKHGLSGKIKIVADKDPLAFCYGFFNPKIYLSASLIKLMNHQELEAVILHEKYHLLKKDNILLVAIDFIKQLFFPFPIVADFVDNFIKSREIKADFYGTYLLGDKKPISAAFKKLLLFNNESSSILLYSSNFTDHRHFETRIHALFGRESFSVSFNLRNIFISVFSFVILTGFFIFPWQKSQADSQTKKPFICLKNTDCSKHC